MTKAYKARSQAHYKLFTLRSGIEMADLYLLVLKKLHKTKSLRLKPKQEKERKLLKII